MRTLRIATTLLLLATVACTEQRRAHRKDPAKLAELVGDTAPKPQHPAAIVFADKIELLGYDVDVSAATPGEPFHVVWYWHVLKAPGPGWQQFTHGIDALGVDRLNLDRARVLSELLPAGEWQAGKYIRDIQEITLPKDWDSRTLALRVGFWNDDERMAVSKGPADDKRRAILFSLPVAAGEAPPVPTLRAHRLAVPLQLDGRLDEADWGDATSTGPFVNTMRGSEGSFGTEARVAYDERALYIAFEVEDDLLKSDFTTHDAHLWEQDCVEVMLDPDGDGKNYFELQVSPRGVTFDTRYDSRRRPRPFGEIAWDSGVRAGVGLRGKLDDDEGDTGYTVEMAIPWTAFHAGRTPATPPKAGDTWRINLFVMDARRRGMRAVGWSPPFVGDFHTLERFGELSFTKAAAEP